MMYYEDYVTAVELKNGKIVDLGKNPAGLYIYILMMEVAAVMHMDFRHMMIHSLFLLIMLQKLSLLILNYLLISNPK